MNATELFVALSAVPGSRRAGSESNGIAAAILVNGVEYARAATSDEPKLRAAHRRRQGGGATPLLLVADDPDADGILRVLGPQKDGPVRRLRAESLLGLVEKTTSMKRLLAVRMLAEEVERLDTERLAGVKVRGLGTEHLLAERLTQTSRWAELAGLAAGVSRAGWRELLNDLGYAIEQLPGQGYLATHGGHPVAVVHPRGSAAQFAKLDEAGRLPEGALVSECVARGAPWGILAAGSRVRLLDARPQAAGTTTRYLELDAASLEHAHLPLLGLLAPAYLAGDGFAAVLEEARDYGQKLRTRIDLVLRQQVLPVLGRELGRWAVADGQDLADDEVRAELEAAALTFVFRVLFLLYAESAGHLPMTNPTYESKSLTRVARRAAEELDVADERATALWDDIALLVKRMRTGQRAWDLPAYNGDLFAADAVAGAATLERAAIPDARLGPALVALARDPENPDTGVDFSGLEVGHLGYVYEGLLSLRLSVADRDFAYDEKRDRYVRLAAGQEPDVRAGEALWLTDEGGRKGGGVYYTRTELVRHLVRGAVGPAFDAHLREVRELAATDPEEAARRLFDFYVLDPACGSAHFLVEVVDELADKIATLLGDLALPPVRAQLERLRAGAGATFGANIEDTALLKRLVLKRCVFGVDLSPMGAEIAKVSLWLSTFVPGLSLAYLDHNIQRGNSLVGVARPEDVAPPAETGQITLWGDEVTDAMRDAATAARELRGIDDRTPDEVAASRQADAALHERIAGAQRIFDLWTAAPFGVAGARDEALLRGGELLAGQESLLADRAADVARREAFLHWPLAFAEVFARERPGFDAVVGNPPWEEITVEELAFYARYRPGLRNMPEAPRRAELATLLAERPELAERLAAEQERQAQLRAALGAAGGYEGGAGDPDTYKLFSQRYRAVLRPGGALGVVLPRSVFLAAGSAGFRAWLFEHAPPERIDVLLNRARWAFDMEPRYSVALLIARRVPPDAARPTEVAGVADSAQAFDAQVTRPGLRLARTALGPALEVPLLPSQADADVLAKLRRDASLVFGAGRWRCFPVREFDETNDRRLWEGADDGLPLWKGASFDQFDPHGADARPCPASEAALRKARKPRPGGGSLVADVADVATRRAAVERTFPRARVAFRDVTRANDSRTARACLVPPAHFLTNTAPYLTFVEDDQRAEATCLAIMNSLPFDWQARRFVEIHLNFFILEGLRLPDLDDASYAALADAGARLSCVDERFADFAAATGVEVGPLTDGERATLRADIDARVAHAYGLTAEELEVVFADFTPAAVPAEYRERVRARFRELA